MKAKYLGITLLISVMLLPAAALAIDTADWQIYKNEVYGYEIKYPLIHAYLPLELRPVGGEKDGREIKVCFAETSVHHGIVVKVYPGKKISKIASIEGIKAPSFRDIKDGLPIAHNWSITKVNSRDAIKHRGDVVITIITNGAVFYIYPWYNFSEFFAEDVISTFKFNDLYA
ncbi:MAG: hypothetical protein WC532_00240 [Candidatus Omnitrophota bacterium]